jgi:hypothetical protein
MGFLLTKRSTADLSVLIGTNDFIGRAREWANQLDRVIAVIGRSGDLKTEIFLPSVCHGQN